MGNERFSDEFKKEAIGQIINRGYSVAEVSERLNVSKHSLYAWLKKDPRNLKAPKAPKCSDATSGPFSASFLGEEKLLISTKKDGA
jgi:transposase-like protein